MDFQSVLVKSGVLATGTSEVVSRMFGRSFKGVPLICLSSVFKYGSSRLLWGDFAAQINVQFHDL